MEFILIARDAGTAVVICDQDEVEEDDMITIIKREEGKCLR